MAVYTQINGADLDSFLIPYNFGELLGFSGIEEGVENSNYLLLTERGRYILTIYEKRVRRSDLPFFLSLMRHLASKGIACPVPVIGSDGRMLRDLVGKPAAVLTFLTSVGEHHPGPVVGEHDHGQPRQDQPHTGPRVPLWGGLARPHRQHSQE